MLIRKCDNCGHIFGWPESIYRITRRRGETSYTQDIKGGTAAYINYDEDVQINELCESCMEVLENALRSIREKEEI